MQTARFHPHMAGHQIVLKSNLEETTQHGSEGFPNGLSLKNASIRAASLA
ncbi:hypothetical protein [Parasutterella excrementihominis]|nr:hypothetical protein [Parasutterella excrementihominis]